MRPEEVRPQGPERRCIVSGETKPIGSLIRFAVSPDGQVLPDLAQDLPGRGLWVTARREELDAAVKARKFARAAKARVTADAGLSDLVERSLSERCLNLLGLARRAGELTAGFEKVKALAKGGEIAVLIGAADAAADGRQKLARLAPGVPLVTIFRGAELSLALGRENVVHAALTSGGLASRFTAEAARLAGFRPANRAPGS